MSDTRDCFNCQLKTVCIVQIKVSEQIIGGPVRMACGANEIKTLFGSIARMCSCFEPREKEASE